jgi:hypothetical protein
VLRILAKWEYSSFFIYVKGGFSLRVKFSNRYCFLQETASGWNRMPSVPYCVGIKKYVPPELLLVLLNLNSIIRKNSHENP